MFAHAKKKYALTVVLEQTHDPKIACSLTSQHIPPDAKDPRMK